MDGIGNERKYSGKSSLISGRENKKDYSSVASKDFLYTKKKKEARRVIPIAYSMQLETTIIEVHSSTV